MTSKLGFFFKNEFGDVTQVTKQWDEVVLISEFEKIVDEFKSFMISIGYSPETVSCIQIVEED